MHLGLGEDPQESSAGAEIPSWESTSIGAMDAGNEQKKVGRLTYTSVDNDSEEHSG